MKYINQGPVLLHIFSNGTTQLSIISKYIYWQSSWLHLIRDSNNIHINVQMISFNNRRRKFSFREKENLLMGTNVWIMNFDLETVVYVVS